MPEEIERVCKILFYSTYKGLPEAVRQQIDMVMLPILIGIVALLYILWIFQRTNLRSEPKIEPSHEPEVDHEEEGKIRLQTGFQGARRSSKGIYATAWISELKIVVRPLLGLIKEKISSHKISAPKSSRILLITAIVTLLFAAVGDWPHDFYVLLKVLIFAVCIRVFMSLENKDPKDYPGILLLLALLYNPFFQIHLHKTTWMIVDWFTLIILSVFCVLFNPADIASSFSSLPGGISTDTKDSRNPSGVEEMPFSDSQRVAPSPLPRHSKHISHSTKGPTSHA